MKTGIELIAEERQRQIEVEGWTKEHDAEHTNDSLALAAVCYAIPKELRNFSYCPLRKERVPDFWPWAKEWWKPCPEDRIRELVKAGALIAAAIDRIFPELAESEDEKVRKELISHLQHEYVVKRYVSDVEYDKWIAWLEKQAEHANFRNKIQIGDKVTRNEAGVLVNLSQLKRVAKPSEKQGEQKPSTQLKPKFKVGDWIACEELNTALIVNVNDDKYEVEFIDGNKGFPYIEYVDRNFHLWTIQDAKDGDVLSYVTDEEDLWIMIYRSLYEPYEGHVHYHALLVNDNFSDKGTCCICIDNLKPATKEQRDTLLKAIADAGYTFDFEKQELKELVEQLKDR